MRNAFLLIAAVGAMLIMITLGHRPRTNPPVVKEHSIESAMKVPERVHQILSKACYDCHSNETRWPWYSAVPPVSGLVESDVAHGRAAMNFSEWTEGSGSTPGLAAGTLAAACVAVEHGLMPKSPYPYLHPEARLSTADIDYFCTWTRDAGAKLRAAARHAAGN